MKTVNSNQLLNKLEDKVENHIHLVTSKLQNLPEPTLLKAASDGGWSIAQCLDHLNGYGNHYLNAMKVGMDHSSKPPASTFKSSWLGNYFTNMMDPETGKRKYKSFKNHVPKQILDPDKVVAEFLNQQEKLLTYLRMGHSKDLNSVRVPISISKWIRLKLGDVFQFIIAHNDRHLRQAIRNLENQGN